MWFLFGEVPAWDWLRYFIVALPEPSILLFSTVQAAAFYLKKAQEASVNGISFSFNLITHAHHRNEYACKTIG